MDDRLPMPLVVPQSVFLTGPLWVLAYVALDYMSFVDSYRGLAITPWNPAAGLALALVLVGGVRYAPVVLVSPAIAGALVRTGSVPISVHLIEGLLFGGSYLVAGLIARRYMRLDPRLVTIRDILTLMLLALGAAAMAALSYVAVLWMAGLLKEPEIVEGFVRFVVGDLIGMLIVTPLLLLGFARRLRPVVNWEAPLQVLAVVVAFGGIFAVPHASEYQLFYLLFLPLLWFTFRSGIAGATVALGVIQVGLIVALHLRHGALADLVSFQMLMISLAATGLVLGGMVSQQQATSTRLRHQQLALSRALRIRSMGEVATAIAHEVNQPITSIRTYTGIARDALEAAQNRNVSEAIERIRAECDRASAIIRATRESLRQQVSRPQPIAVEQLLGEVKELLLDRLETTSVQLVTHVAAGARAIIGDPVQLKQALFNIIDNSIDAIEDTGLPGRVTVVANAPSLTVVEFVISDSGPGFSQELIDYGISPLVSTKPEGSGIGLSIARSVAEAHGGTISIERDKSETVVRLRIASPAQVSDENRISH